MDTFIQDLRHALRLLRRSPGFATVAILTLALGIGATTAIFSVVNGVVLRPLPYDDPDELYMVWEDKELRGGPATEWTGRATFRDWRERNRAFEGMAAVNGWAPTLTGGDRPEALAGALVSSGYFSVLGLAPALGRGFLPEEEAPGAGNVVVLSHELWQRRFGGDPTLPGGTLTLNGETHRVVGILRPGFRPPIVQAAELWAPLPLDPEMDDRGNYFLRVVGRLAPGVTPEAARADMQRVAASIAAEHPVDYRDVGVTLEPLQEAIVGPVRTPLLVLLGAVGLILLIACANVANLLLARAAGREREVAVRSALGAGRRRLARQLLTESLVLATCGGLAGLALGAWGTELLVHMAPPGTPRLEAIGLHPVVFLFAALSTLGTGVLFGLAPALGLSRRRASEVLREGGRGVEGGGRGRLRSALVVTELALGVALLVGAGLLLRSFGELRSVDPGFRVQSVLSGRLVFPAAGYDREAITGFMDQLERRLEARAGVRGAGLVSVLPLSGSVSDISFGIEGRLPAEGEEPAADLRRATPGFFRAMGIPLIRGRTFDVRDREGAGSVAVISQGMMRAHFPGEDPVGRRIKVGNVRDPESPWFTVVGVVGSVRSRALDRDPEPEIYLSAAQYPARGMNVVLRGEREPEALAGTLRETVASLDPDMPLAGLAALEELFANAVAPQRFLSRLLGAFAGLGLVLGLVGIYGVMAYAVSRRTREIGVRIALGAAPRDVLGQVMRQGATLTAAGLGAGFLLALLASRALAGILYEVSPTDPLTLAAVPLLLGATALLACWIPARRATRVDPVEALRAE